jgi:hypothetical protein
MILLCLDCLECARLGFLGFGSRSKMIVFKHLLTLSILSPMVAEIEISICISIIIVIRIAAEIDSNCDISLLGPDCYDITFFNPKIHIIPISTD